MSEAVESDTIDSTSVLNYSYSKIFRNRPELLNDVKLTSPDGKEVLSNLRRSCLLDENIERLWKPQGIQLVQNSELEKNYKLRKKEFKENGRKGKEIEDRVVFTPETWAGVQKICKFGIRCLENKPQVLGDSRYGVHLCRHFDVLLKYMAFTKSGKFRYVIIFKAIFGRTKPVTARLTDDQEAIEPIPTSDSHISNIKPDMQMDIRDALAHNYIYLYEYDEDTTFPVQFPRHILPYAVIQLSRTDVSIETPLKWGGTKRVVKKNNNIQTTQRKTWNSRAAAYCAGVSSESLKKNGSLVEDAHTTDETDTEQENNIYHNGKTLSIKPCKIELFRSDMDIDERIKVPSNYEFDTFSGTKLIATKTGFVKDPACNFENSNVKAMSETNNKDINNTNGMPLLKQIKQEPIDPDTQMESTANNVSGIVNSSVQIKQEKEDDFGYQLGQDNVLQPSQPPLDKIANNKKVLLKRLKQVEREIHWKKQKIDQLQKKSSKSIKSEGDKIPDIDSESNSSRNVQNHSVKSESETSQVCQNETNRILSLTINTREQSEGDIEEGDSTPTLDEPRQRKRKKKGDIKKPSVVCSENAHASPPRLLANVQSDNTHASPPILQAKVESGERENLFDAYCSKNMFCVDDKKSTNTIQLSTPPIATTSFSTNLQNKVSLSLENTLKPLLPYTQTDNTGLTNIKVPSTPDKQTVTTSAFNIFSSTSLTKSQSGKPKQFPLDILINEKKCSPFLAKYLEKRLSIGSVEDGKNENIISSPSDDKSLIASKERQVSTSNNALTCDPINEMPQLSPVRTQCGHSNSFNLTSTFANIKTIMETGEIPSSSRLEKPNMMLSSGQKLRDPRLQRLRDDLTASEINPPDLSTPTNDNETCEEKSETNSTSDSSNTTEESSENSDIKWLPGVLIRDRSDEQNENEQSQNKMHESGTKNSDDISKRNKADLPQNVKDEMQKTLQKLGDAIKIIQSRCSSDEESSSMKKPVTNSHNETPVNTNIKDDVNSTVCFMSNNDITGSGTSNIESDAERANRVLNDVFKREAVTSSEQHQISASVTNVHQIQTFESTNIEIKTTQYAETMENAYVNGFDATSYSDVATTDVDGIGHRIPVKLSGMGMRRPYTKWAESMRNKAMDRQKRLYKKKLTARRFGLDKLKRKGEKGKKIESKGAPGSKRGKKKRVSSKSKSEEKCTLSGDSPEKRSRSDSRSNRSSSPVGKRKRFRKLKLNEQNLSTKEGLSTSQLDPWGSPKRVKKANSPIRDRSFLTFKERGHILRKLEKGYKLTDLEKYKLEVNKYKFFKPEGTLQSENTETNTSPNRKSPDTSGSDKQTNFDNKDDIGTVWQFDGKRNRNNDKNDTFSRQFKDQQSDYRSNRRGYNPYKRSRRDFINSKNKKGKYESTANDFCDIDNREQNYFRSVSRSLANRSQKSNSKERPLPDDNEERHTEKTLSKAMTSLLSKIIQGDNQTVDNSTEGQMANVIYQLMKQKVQNETANTLPQMHDSTLSRHVQSFNDYTPSSGDRQIVSHNYRQDGNSVFETTGSSSSYRSHYKSSSDDSRDYQSSRDVYPYKDSQRSRGRSRGYHGNGDFSRSQNFTSGYSSYNNSHFNGSRGFPNRQFQYRGRFNSPRRERDRYQANEFDIGRREFRHASASSTSSSTSRYDSSKESDGRFYNATYLQNPYL